MISRDISDEQFEALSKEKKKTYVAELLIRISGAQPIPDQAQPIAIIMAGVPGAGKTEFLDSLVEGMQRKNLTNIFVRIDLDQIVTVYPGYAPESYARFRNQANYALARAIDMAKHRRYNLMIDGTFAGRSEASIHNIERLLDAGYEVFMFYMYDKAETAWSYTKSRETETKRGIDKDGFIQACKNVSGNIQVALSRFRDNTHFHFGVVVQKELRDKDYIIARDEFTIDNVINKGYNIDTLKEL